MWSPNAVRSSGVSDAARAPEHAAASPRSILHDQAAVVRDGSLERAAPSLEVRIGQARVMSSSRSSSVLTSMPSSAAQSRMTLQPT